ncbi:MAG: hypothetical protein QM805_07790 [Pseudomonas sp.]
MTDEMTRHAAMGFEAVKVSMSQDKNGIILRLNVHPNDCPKELITDWVGTRYMVGMVRINDDDTPDDRGYAEVQKMITSAGQLCRNESFFTFLSVVGLVDHHISGVEERENASAEAVRDYCGIQSRAEMKTNEEARKKFETMRQSFKNWKEGKPWKI